MCPRGPPLVAQIGVSLRELLVEIGVDAKNLRARSVAREIVVAVLLPHQQSGLCAFVVHRREADGRTGQTVLREIVRLFVGDAGEFRAGDAAEQRSDGVRVGRRIIRLA